MKGADMQRRMLRSNEVFPIPLRAIRRSIAPSPYLLPEIMSGFLGTAGETSAGVFLVYQRNEGDFYCHSFRLIRASSLRALTEYICGDPPGVQLTIRLVNLRYPGQLWAAERFFACRLEVAP
jgi:hypothetical protein